MVKQLLKHTDGLRNPERDHGVTRITENVNHHVRVNISLNITLIA